jgi:hypothetical protein
MRNISRFSLWGKEEDNDDVSTYTGEIALESCEAIANSNT